MVFNSKDALSSLSGQLPIMCDHAAENRTSCLVLIEEALEGAARCLGYEYLRYSYWAKNPVKNKSDVNSFSVNFSSFPPSWEELYNRNNLYIHDPVVRVIQDSIASKHLLYGAWQDAYRVAIDNPLGETPEQKQDYLKQVAQLMATSREHKLLSGYYYSWGDNLRQIVLSLASGREDLNGQPVGNTIHSMVILVNQAIQITQGCTFCNKALRIDGSEPIRLSRTELHILHLFHTHRHATQKQIAALCSRSVDTVNHHLRSIRRKLNVPGASGHSLAAYAAELNLL